MCIRPLIQIVFDFGPPETEMVVWATRAFLLGLMGHSWLEVGVRSWYAQQNARLPLLAAVAQIAAYFPLALLFSRSLGVPGLALADTLTFTGEALLLLFLLNRRFPGSLSVGSTLIRVGLASLGISALVSFLLRLPYSTLPLTFGSLAIGGLLSLPFIWTELKMLIKL